MLHEDVQSLLLHVTRSCTEYIGTCYMKLYRVYWYMVHEAVQSILVHVTWNCT